MSQKRERSDSNGSSFTSSHEGLQPGNEHPPTKRWHALVKNFDVNDFEDAELAAMRSASNLAKRGEADMAAMARDVPPAPVFRPTPEEWADPAGYIASIRAEAERAGIAKVVPPRGWAPPSTEAARLTSPAIYPTRLQAVHRLSEGLPFPDGNGYTFREYKAMAHRTKREK